MGSIPAARLAGTRLARRATDESPAPAAINVPTSKALVSKSMLPMRRVSANDPASPMANPTRTTRIPSPTTRRIMAEGVAPRAVRIPSSLVRWVTFHDTTP